MCMLWNICKILWFLMKQFVNKVLFPVAESMSDEF